MQTAKFHIYEKALFELYCFVCRLVGLYESPSFDTHLGARLYDLRGNLCTRPPFQDLPASFFINIKSAQNKCVKTEKVICLLYTYVILISRRNRSLPEMRKWKVMRGFRDMRKIYSKMTNKVFIHKRKL